MNLAYKAVYTIIGSGFGLYGYLPALTQLGMKVVLPTSYKDKVLARPELSKTLNHIEWVKDQNTALNITNGLVVATTPKIQKEFISYYLTFSNIKRILIEKPIAITPEQSVQLLDQLDKSKKRYAIGYTFLYLSWQKSLVWPSDLGLTVELNWSFMAHHFQHDVQNWKRFHSEGGGVLRFYGIHLLAMLALRGYSNIKNSSLKGPNKNEPEQWTATFAGHNLPDCLVNVDCRSTSQHFQIGHSGSNDLILSLDNIFAQENLNNGDDSRVPSIAAEIKYLDEDSLNFSFIYKQTNLLWSLVEEISNYDR
jgi:predicted dehydrogenase